MIKNGSSPARAPTIRTVYPRAKSQRSVVPAATKASETLTAPPSDDVLCLTTRVAEITPTATQLMAIDSPKWSDVQMKAFSRDTAHAMLADPMQAIRSQRAPMAREIIAFLAV
ncbi:hypothetical protein [Blastomonas sp.]|uniref:hypothetical protein n=1 Tax=Blastomonas sp. TaxID=1909299 RepID=UPI003919AF9D